MSQRCRNVSNGAEQNEGIILRRHKASALPEASGLFIDGVDHQRSTADQSGRLNTALERVFDQTRTDPLACPSGIRGKLAEEKARDWIGRLAGADRTRHDRRNHGGRRQTIVSDHAPRLVNDENGGKTLLLIGKGARLQPVIERRLATGEFGNIMRGGERFGSR